MFSDEYRTSSTRDEQTEASEERLHNQADSATLNDDHVNDHVHSAFDFQGSSTTSFDRHALSSASSSFLPPAEHDQQHQRGNQDSHATSSHTVNDEDIENMNPNPARPRQEVTFDLNNCILRCFEAHQQTVARRRAAKQARKARRHQQSQQPQQQQEQQEQQQQQQQQIQQQQQEYQNLYQTGQIPFAPVASSSFDATAVSNNLQAPPNDYYQFNTANIQTPYGNPQQQTSYDYSSQMTYPSPYETIDSTVPTEIQHLKSEYYQQQPAFDFGNVATSTFAHGEQQIPAQPSGTFEYTRKSYQTQEPIYDHQNIQQISSQYPYSTETIESQQAQQQRLDFSSERRGPSEHYPDQVVSKNISQHQGPYSQPTGTYEYTRESYQSQQPIYDYQDVNQQTSQYTYNAEQAQQQVQPEAYNYDTSISSGTYGQTETLRRVLPREQAIDYSSQVHQSADYQAEQQIPTATSYTQGSYGQPTGTHEYTRESYQSQQPIYDYQDVNQQTSQYTYNAEQAQQQVQPEAYNYDTSISSGTYGQTETLRRVLPREQAIDYSSQVHQSADYHAEQQIPTATSYTQGSYGQPTGTHEYTRESYQSQQPIYNYQDINEQASQYAFNAEDVQQPDTYSYDTSVSSSTYAQTEPAHTVSSQEQAAEFISEARSVTGSYPELRVPASTIHTQGSFGQPTGTYEYSRESYQSQEPIYDSQNITQQTTEFLQRTKQEEVKQQDSDAKLKETVEHVEQKQADQTVESSKAREQKPVSIPVSRIHDTHASSQQSTGVSVPTGTVEYTREAYYSQEPLPDNITSETFNERQSYPEQTGGQQESSYYSQYTSTEQAPPYAVLRDSDKQLPHETRQIYDLQNYTNESLGPTRPPIRHPSSYEEGQQHLLQQTRVPFQQADQRSEKDTSSYSTFSSLPPPPFSEEIDHQQASIATTVSDFPAPPTPDRHTYQLRQQRPGRVITSIVPSHEQTNRYIQPQAQPPRTTPYSDRNTDADISEVENFDLRECIARCYSQYANIQPGVPICDNRQSEERIDQYQQVIQQPAKAPIYSDYRQVIQQPETSPIYPHHQQTFLQPAFRCEYIEQQQQQQGIPVVVHFTDTWTQTPSEKVISNYSTVQQAQEQVPSYSYGTPSYAPQLETADRSFDLRGQPTIEYSPPLITHPRQVYHTPSPSIPVLPRQVDRYEQQQTTEQQTDIQPIYDHALPVPPHLSFNDNDYRPNLYSSVYETAQPRQPVDIPFHDEEKQISNQQRYRAHSEPPSIQQDIITSAPPLEPFSSPVFEEKPRRAVSIPAIQRQQQQQQQQQYHEQQQQRPMSTQVPPLRLLNNGRAYEMDTPYAQYTPRIDAKTGLCLVPCPNAQKYAHLPPHLRPELFCIELPPPSLLPPVPPPAPEEIRQEQQQQQQQQQHGRWCVKCCCVPGRTMIKKIVYKQVEGEQKDSRLVA